MLTVTVGCKPSDADAWLPSVDAVVSLLRSLVRMVSGGIYIQNIYNIYGGVGPGTVFCLLCSVFWLNLVAIYVTLALPVARL